MLLCGCYQAGAVVLGGVANCFPVWDVLAAPESALFKWECFILFSLSLAHQ